MLMLLLRASTPFLYQCSDARFEKSQESIKPLFSSQVSGWGELFTEMLINTAVELKARKVELSDRIAVLDVSRNVAWGTFEERGIVAAEQRISFANARTAGEEAATLSITEMQESEEITSKGGFVTYR